MKYLLGIDFGGGASKATLLSKQGAIIAESTVEYETLHPTLGACEQRPQDWLDALCENTRCLLQKSSIAPADIACIAIDSATHSSLVCGADFVPLLNAIHWTDTRSRRQANYLKETCGAEIFKKCYHSPDTIWTLPQLMWLKENEPEVFGKIQYIFFEKDYIRYFLTGVFCTDRIEAAGSMLYDLTRQEWSQELCDLAGIQKSFLPPLCEPTDVIGAVTPATAAQTGLCAGTPVICGTTDTVMEVFASGAVQEEDITVKLATAGRICVITNQAFPNRHLVNYPHIVPGLWYPGTATKSCAASYRWYRDTFGGDYKTLDAGAAEIALGAEGLMFHPYLNGELTPYADPTLCGSFIGIRATHTKAHFTRAVLEGVGYSLMDSMKTLNSLGISHRSAAVAIGGGAKGRLWRQIIADMLNIDLQVTKSSDSSLGSAMLAGVACGMFATPLAAVQACVQKTEVTHPNLENHEKYEALFAEYKQVHNALAPIYQNRV